MGYFQGIVSVVVIAASGTFKEFINNSKAIQWLFYSGLRGQQAFPVTSVEPSIIQDSIVGREGTPSPMLSKIPFYQQKPVFSIRYLLIGVLYHSKYLDRVTDIVKEDLEDEEL